MKKLQFKLIAAAFASFVAISNTASAQALHTSYTTTKNAEEPFAVKYIGNDGEYLLFEVTVRSNDNKLATLGISDKNEGELYNDNFRTNYKVQKLKIEKRDKQDLDFKLEVGNSTYTKSFSVNTSRFNNTEVSEKDTTVL